MKRSLTEIFLDLLVNALLVFAVYILVQVELAYLAIAFVLLSKWQMFLAHRRYWLPNIIANSCDVLVGLSSVGFLIYYEQPAAQLLTAFLYFVWLVVLKPRSDRVSVVLQAAVCQFVALSGLFLFPIFSEGWQVIPLGWLVGWVSANHFFSAFDESARKILTHVWAIILAQMSWIFWHWSLVYFLPSPLPPIPLIAVFATVISYCFASLYIEHSKKKLNKRRLIFHLGFCLALLIVIIVLTNWNVVI